MFNRMVWPALLALACGGQKIHGVDGDLRVDPAAVDFGKFTTNNIGRPFAIVLDDKVLSAPVIRSEILGGSGQISGNFTVQSASELALKIRSLKA